MRSRYGRRAFRAYPIRCVGERIKVTGVPEFREVAWRACALFVQMDTDIASQLNKICIDAGGMQRKCCEEALNNRFSLENEPEHCYYILPTENTETWLLASHEHFTALDNSLGEIKDYELIVDTEQRLIDIGYPSRKKVGNKRKLNKKPARKYNSYAQQLVENLSLARQRCEELNRLCVLILSI